MNQPLSLLHVLNLDTIGGVESLYINFIQELLKNRQRTETLHHTIVSGSRCHPIYQSVFDQFGYKPFHELYLSRIKIPKFLRWIVDVRRGMIDNVINGPSRWVFWNRIEERDPPEDAVYYEHGASWMVEPNEKRKKFVKGMKKIIANSKAAQTLVSHMWDIPFDDIALVENPLRPDIAIRSEPRKGPKEGHIHLGYIGRLIPLKAPGILLHTLSTLLTKYKRQVTLHIAGEGSEKDFLVSLAKSLGVENNVKFLGRVDKINEFYDSIDFLIIPSVREPLGLVALEASAHGIPVIASQVDGLAESVADQKSGILIPPSLDIVKHQPEFIKGTSGLPRFVVDSVHQKIIDPRFLDPSMVAQTIDHIVSTPGLYEELSAGGISHVMSRITFDQYVESLLREICDMPYYVEVDEIEHEVEHTN